MLVVDGKALDYQTMKEYDRFEKGSANSNASTRILQRQLEDRDEKMPQTILNLKLNLSDRLEINIDYILMLVEKYHEGNCEDKGILTSIRKAVDASIQLRSKRKLIEAFISRVNVDTQVTTDWCRFVFEQEENDLAEIIAAEKLKPEETRKFVSNTFCDCVLKTSGTEIDKLISRYAASGVAAERRKSRELLKN